MVLISLSALSFQRTLVDTELCVLLPRTSLFPFGILIPLPGVSGEFPLTPQVSVSAQTLPPLGSPEVHLGPLSDLLPVSHLFLLTILHCCVSLFNSSEIWTQEALGKQLAGSRSTERQNSTLKLHAQTGNPFSTLVGWKQRINQVVVYFYGFLSGASVMRASQK